LETRYASQILAHVLFTDITGRDDLTIAILDCDSEEPLREENAFGVMAQTSVSNACNQGFRFIEPLMDAKVILGRAAELAGAVLCVFEWVSHD
jgi:hypothetical protein